MPYQCEILLEILKTKCRVNHIFFNLNIINKKLIKKLNKEKL